MKTNNAGNYVKQGSDESSSSTSKTVTGLANGTPYQFKVFAKNAAGTETTGKEQTGTSIPVTTPDPPATVSASAGDEQITVSWSAPSNNGGSAITGYEVHMKTNNAGSYVKQGSDESSSSTSKTVTGLANGTPYQFKVFAKNAVGTEATGKEQTGTTTPSAAGVQINNDQATLPDVQSGATTSNVPLVLIGTATHAVVVAIASSPSTTCVLSTSSVTLSGSTQQTFTVSPSAIGSTGTCTMTFTTTSDDAAYNGLVLSARTVKVIGKPGPPTNVVAVSKGATQKLYVTWDSPSGVINTGNQVINGYNIQTSIDGGVNWNDAVSDTGNNAVEKTLDGLVNDQEYQVRIATINPSGQSVSWSTASTAAAPCAAGFRFVPVSNDVFVSGSSNRYTAGVSSFEVGSLYLDCPIETDNAVVSVSTTSSDVDLCRVASASVNKNLKSDPTKGIKIFVQHVDVPTVSLKQGGGSCRLNFNPSSTGDSAYDALSTMQNVCDFFLFFLFFFFFFFFFFSFFFVPGNYLLPRVLIC